MVQNIIRNIYAYSNDVRQTNYSMLYHGAFDFANTDRTEFGNALFEGKMIAYSNGILDNNGTIQLVDSDDSPKGEKSPFLQKLKILEYLKAENSLNILLHHLDLP